MSVVQPADDGDSSAGEEDAPDMEDEVLADGFAEGSKLPEPGKMISISGYENIYQDSSAVKPPPNIAQADQIEKKPQPDFTPVPVISEDTARQALLEHVSEQFCWGTGAAKKLKFTNLQSSTSYHYILESFTESRSTAWTHEPYIQQPVDGPENGPAPGPWMIEAKAASLFQNETQTLEVPHTANIQDCHTCGCRGFLICSRCCGRGKVRCGRCRGTGKRRKRQRKKDGGYRTVRVNCFTCHGSGKRQCLRCRGSGKVTCPTCKGHIKLKWFVRLTVQWINRVDQHIIERTALPDQLIAHAEGSVAFEDMQLRVFPIVAFPDQEINVNSAKLVEQHGRNFPNDLILMQRHRIRAVPVTECQCDVSGKPLTYFVFGLETKVHAPDYPDQCCWGCSIL